MAIKTPLPRILQARVAHRRLFPRVNAFTYDARYHILSLRTLDHPALHRNRKGFLSFHDSDHGARDGSDLSAWTKGILERYGIRSADGDILLVTLLRRMGFVFNPVSFWLCLDHTGDIRAVICQVNNTFGENHTYLCAHANGQAITATDIMTGEKVFHVSPFLERSGHYTFRFSLTGESFGAWIDYYDSDGRKKLVTALTGKHFPLENTSPFQEFLKSPLETFTIIWRIHCQALRLIAKGIRIVPKPEQTPLKVSGTNNLTKE